jgi:two-component system, NarL family, response regulator NreC
MVLVISILIADDHGLIRAGLRSLLNAAPDLRVIGEAADGGQALALAEQLQPDVVLADISMPVANGIQVAQELKLRSPRINVLIVTMHEDAGMLQEAMHAGARGYLIKRALEAELIAAVRTVARGEIYVHPDVQRLSVTRDEAPVPSQTIPLNAVERLLLRLLTDGCSGQRIAEELGISHEKASQQKAELMRKLGVQGRVGLIRYAQDHGLIN